PGAPGLFGVSATVDADKFEEAREAILAEIDAMKTSPVLAQELSKAVKQFVSGTLGSRKTMQGQAQDLGSNWLAANDLNFSERYLSAVKDVTPQDILRVARLYLTTENRTLYALLPTGTAPQPAAHDQASADHPVQKFELANGLRLLVKEDHRLPFVEFRAVFKGGVLAETTANNGITMLMGKLLLKGTRTRSAEDIAREIESVGGSIDSYGGNNSFGLNAEVLSSDFQTGLDLVADVLLNPTFPESALKRERDVQLAAIRAQKDQLLQSAAKLMRHAMFCESGYGLDPLGTEPSLETLGVADVSVFHQQFTVPSNGVLAIFGDVNTSEVRAAVERAFGDWKQPAATASASPAAGLPAQPDQRVVQIRDKKQAVIIIGYPGTTLKNPERYPLELIQETCSDLGSRLFLRVREKLGLAYYVGAQNFVGLAPGYFAFYVGTMPEKTEQVEQELLKEAELLRTEGLTEEELKRSKAKIIGQRKIARQDLGGYAMTTALDELYGLGYAYSDADDARYEAVTLDQIKTVARKYLETEKSVIALVGPGQEVTAP
ncbi:MAG: M16 family metallopeptidase, partial [Limisphaerales bacterium]